MYKKCIKRFLDFILALLGLIILSPLLLVVYVWLTIANKGAGAIFTQERPGKDERIFKLYKFKSMTDERDAEGKLLPDAQRLTKVGRFVRKTSIDELPQLWNVLKGNMSFIGPRPLTPIYLQLLNAEQKRRHEVRPGITGWAQVNGRNHCKLSLKFKLDIWYVDNYSFLTDCKIFFMTIKNVLTRDSVGSGQGDMKDIDDLGFLPKILEMKNNKGYE
jgi:undecaprenyl phosphate N,N'-diacetylbacillosamine 1-phosphate transferase